jgi:hypothetical protein
MPKLALKEAIFAFSVTISAFLPPISVALAQKGKHIFVFL